MSLGAPMIRVMRRLTIVLLMATVAANILFASSPLPLGGPNVVLGVLLVLASMVYAFLRFRAAQEQNPAPFIRAAFEEFRPIIPAVAVGALMLAWMFGVHSVTDTFDYRPIRWWQIGMGICVLISVYVVVDTLLRASLVILAFVLATFASTLFGVAVSFIGSPFLAIWLNIATVFEKDLTIILATSRVAGLAPDSVAFGYQLAVAVPLAFAALLYGGLGKDAATSHRNIYRVVLFLALMTMITVMFLNGTRSVFLGVAVGLLVILIPSITPTKMSKASRLRALLALPFMALWLAAFFNPVYTVADTAPVFARVWNIARPVVWDPAATAVDTAWDATASTVARALGSDAEPVDVEVPVVETPAPETPVVRTSPTEVPAIEVPVVVTPAAEVPAVEVPVVVTPAAEVPAVETPVDETPAIETPVDETPGTPEPTPEPVLPISALAPGGETPTEGGDIQILGYKIDGLEPGKAYQVQLLARGEKTFWGQSEAAAIAEGDGSLTITWHDPDDWDVISYPFRLLEDGATEWTAWASDSPIQWTNQMSGTPTHFDWAPIIFDLEHGTTKFSDCNVQSAFGHVFDGLDPWRKYDIQLRMKNARGFWGQSDIVSAYAGSIGLPLTWRQSPLPAPLGAIQFRVRPSEDGAEWAEWRGFFPSLQGQTFDIPDREKAPLAIEGLAVAVDGYTSLPGSERGGLTLEDIIYYSDLPLDGHWIHHLSRWKEYALQLRAWNEYGYGPDGRTILVKADEDGSFAFTWHKPTCFPNIEGYQYRLNRSSDRDWLPWRDFVPGQYDIDAVARAEMALYESGRDFVPNTRIWSVQDESAQARVYMASTAFRYSMDHPLGTGRYTPGEQHLSEEIDVFMAEHILNQLPHNQFLYLLVHFGFPGLVMAVLFYLLILWALISSGRFIVRSRGIDLYFIAFAVAGAMTAYGIHGLFHDVGPFVIDWIHFVIIGLAFSVRRITASRESNDEPQSQ